MLRPLNSRMTTHPNTSAHAATSRRSRICRRRSRALATSALPKMVSPTMPDTASCPSRVSGRAAAGTKSAGRLMTRLRSSPEDVY